jgi:hypothetical protein
VRARVFASRRCGASRLSVLLLALAVTLTIACDAPADDDAAGFTVRDSAGIALVHSAAPAANAPRLALREELRIGVVEGEEHLQFFRVFDVAMAADGRLYVANAGSNEVRVFERDGSYVRSLGRTGDGPGEFRFTGRLLLDADTLIVIDGQLSRATLFDTTGAVVRTEPLRYGTLSVSPLRHTQDGWIVALDDYRGWPYQVGVAYQDTTRLAFVAELATTNPAATDRAPTDRAPTDRMTTTRAPGPTQIVDVLRPRTYGIQSPSGTMTANTPLWEPRQEYAADGLGRVHISHGSPYVIETWTADAEGARLVRRLTREHAPVAVGNALVDRYFAEAETYFDTTSQRGHEFDIGRAAQLGRRPLPHATVLPALGRVRTGHDGSIWVERPDLVEDPLKLEWTRAGPQPSHWDVFDPDGRFVGTVELPTGYRINSVTATSAAGVVRDELDVEYVVRWAVGG